MEERYDHPSTTLVCGRVATGQEMVFAPYAEVTASICQLLYEEFIRP